MYPMIEHVRASSSDSNQVLTSQRGDLLLINNFRRNMSSSMMGLIVSDLSNTLFCVELLTRLPLSDKWKCYYISDQWMQNILRQNKFSLQRTTRCQLTRTTLNWMSEFRDRLWSRHASVRGDVSCALRVDGPVGFFVMKCVSVMNIMYVAKELIILGPTSKGSELARPRRTWKSKFQLQQFFVSPIECDLSEMVIF